MYNVCPRLLHPASEKLRQGPETPEERNSITKYKHAVIYGGGGGTNIKSGKIFVRQYLRSSGHKCDREDEKNITTQDKLCNGQKNVPQGYEFEFWWFSSLRSQGNPMKEPDVSQYFYLIVSLATCLKRRWKTREIIQREREKIKTQHYYTGCRICKIISPVRQIRKS